MTRTQSGFTLFEVIIAVFVVAVAFSGIYAIYASMIDVTARAEHDSVIEESARLVLDQVAFDLKSLYLPEKAGTANNQRYAIKIDENDPENLISFTTMASLDFDPFAPGMRLNRVTYSLEEVESSDPVRYRLIRKERPFASLDGKWTQTELELCDSIKTFTIEMEEPKVEETYAGLGKAKYLFLVHLTLVRNDDERDYALALASDMGVGLQ